MLLPFALPELLIKEHIENVYTQFFLKTFLPCLFGAFILFAFSDKIMKLCKLDDNKSRYLPNSIDFSNYKSSSKL